MADILPDSFRPGRSELFTGNTPIGQNVATFSVPLNTYIDLVCVTWEFTNTTTAVRMGLGILRGITYFVHTVCSGNIGTGTWNLTAGAGLSATLFLHTFAVIMALPPNILLEPGDTIVVKSTTLTAPSAMTALNVYGYPRMRLEA